MNGPSSPDGSVDPSIDRMVHCRPIADTYDETFARYGLFAYDQALLARWFDRPGRLLDLGCGTGRTLLEFGRRGFAVTGVDLAPRMLEIARQKLDAAGLAGVKLHLANIADLPLEQLQPPYDYAVCLGATLGYVRGHENRARAVRQAASLLAPGGQYVLHVQNLLRNVHSKSAPWVLTGLARWLVGRGELGDQVLWRYRGLKWVYMHAFRPSELRRLVREAGLDLVEIAYLNRTSSGPLAGNWLAAWRSCGYIVRCRRPGGNT